MRARKWRPSKGWPHLLGLFLLAAGCTSKPAPTSVPPPTQELDVVATAASLTLSPTLAPELGATPTPELPIQFVPWPQQGNLLVPSGIEVTFEASLDDLPPGGYVLRWESQTLAGQIQAVSFPQQGVTILASVPETDLFSGLRQSNLAASTYVSHVGGPPPVLQVFDLRAGRTWLLSPICNTISGTLSPSGEYFLSYCKTSCPACENNLTPGMSPDLEVFEVISVTDGTGFRIGLASKGEREPVRLSWFGDRQLIASRVWIDEQFAICVIDVDEQSARCPYSSKSGYVAASDVAAGETVPLVLPPGPGPLEGLIMPSICLMRGDCDGILDLGEIQGGLYMSPSGQTILLYSTLPSEHTLVAFLKPPRWEVEPVIDLNGNYGFDAWCPAEDCILLEGSGWPRPSYRLGPDGTLTLFPYDNIIASFNIP